MNKFIRAAVLSSLKAAALFVVATMLGGCSANTGSDQASNQPARTFNRGGQTQQAVDTTSGAGHADANNSMNFGGGMGGTSNARTH